MGLAMIEARKQRISAAFGAAADHYDDHAGPQRWAAEQVAKLGFAVHPDAVRILEVGCGTGLLTRQIAALWPDARLVATDLSPTMVARAAAQLGNAALFRMMDGEWPTDEAAPFDMILSSLTFQWFSDLPGAIGRLMALLRPGGHLVFSTMGRESLKAWRDAHATCGLDSGVPDYPAMEDVRHMLTAFGHATVHRERVSLEQPGAISLLRHLRGIGAVVPHGERRPLAAGALRRVMAEYDRRGKDDEYEILFGQVRSA